MLLLSLLCTRLPPYNPLKLPCLSEFLKTDFVLGPKISIIMKVIFRKRVYGFLRANFKSIKMAQQIKPTTTKPGDLSLAPEAT